MKWSKHIPDRTRISTVAGETYLVFNPAWWRLDRWLAWLWITRVIRLSIVFLKFTAVQRDKDGHRLVEFRLPSHPET